MSYPASGPNPPFNNQQQWQPHAHDYPQQWQPQPQKKRGGCLKWFAILAGLFILLIVIIAAVSLAVGGSNNNDSSDDNAGANGGQAGISEGKDSAEQPPSGSTVNLEVETADGSNVSVTYTNASDGVSQAQDNATASPWSKELQVDRHGSLNLSVFAQQEGSGDVTCRILVDGQEVNSNTSSGPYSIASCNYADFLR